MRKVVSWKTRNISNENCVRLILRKIQEYTYQFTKHRTMMLSAFYVNVQGSIGRDGDGLCDLHSRTISCKQIDNITKMNHTFRIEGYVVWLCASWWGSSEIPVYFETIQTISVSIRWMGREIGSVQWALQNLTDGIGRCDGRCVMTMCWNPSGVGTGSATWLGSMVRFQTKRKK